MQVLSWDQEDPLEEGMAAHFSVLAWEIPWREEPGGLQSMGLQRSQTRLSTLHAHTTTQAACRMIRKLSLENQRMDSQSLS